MVVVVVAVVTVVNAVAHVVVAAVVDATRDAVVFAVDAVALLFADVDCSICKRERKQRQTNPNKGPCTGVGCIHMETDIDRNIPATA